MMKWAENPILPGKIPLMMRELSSPCGLGEENHLRMKGAENPDLDPGEIPLTMREIESLRPHPEEIHLMSKEAENTCLGQEEIPLMREAGEHHQKAGQDKEEAPQRIKEVEDHIQNQDPEEIHQMMTNKGNFLSNHVLEESLLMMTGQFDRSRSPDQGAIHQKKKGAEVVILCRDPGSAVIVQTVRAAEVRRDLPEGESHLVRVRKRNTNQQQGVGGSLPYRPRGIVIVRTVRVADIRNLPEGETHLVVVMEKNVSQPQGVGGGLLHHPGGAVIVQTVKAAEVRRDLPEGESHLVRVRKRNSNQQQGVGGSLPHRPRGIVIVRTVRAADVRNLPEGETNLVRVRKRNVSQPQGKEESLPHLPRRVTQDHQRHQVMRNLKEYLLKDAPAILQSGPPIDDDECNHVWLG